MNVAADVTCEKPTLYEIDGASQKVLIEHYALGADNVVDIKRQQSDGTAGYAKPLFDYLLLKAPQIGDLYEG